MDINPGQRRVRFQLKDELISLERGGKVVEESLMPKNEGFFVRICGDEVHGQPAETPIRMDNFQVDVSVRQGDFLAAEGRRSRPLPGNQSDP